MKTSKFFFAAMMAAAVAVSFTACDPKDNGGDIFGGGDNNGGDNGNGGDNPSTEVWTETFGTGCTKTYGSTGGYWPYMEQYDGYDHPECTYTGWSVSVRNPKGDNNYVWIPASKADTLVMAGLPAGTSVSFKLANGSKTACQSDVLKVYCNDQEITPAGVELAGQYEFKEFSAAISVSDKWTLKFIKSAEDGSQLELDDVKIK